MMWGGGGGETRCMEEQNALGLEDGACDGYTKLPEGLEKILPDQGDDIGWSDLESGEGSLHEIIGVNMYGFPVSLTDF